MHEEASEGGDGRGVREVAGRGADPVVIASLALGWEMADLYAGRELDSPVLELPDTLPGIYLDGRPKYFKGPDKPRLGDLAYTEAALFGM